MEQHNAKPIALYALTPPTETNKFGLENVTDISDYSKPTLICLGGSGTDTEDTAALYGRFLQNALGRIDVFEPSLRIMTAVYPHGPDTLDEIMEQHNYDYNTPHGYYSDMALGLVTRQFLPLIATDTQVAGHTIAGKKRSLEEIKRSFSNIRFVTHSFGGVAGEQIGNALVHCMQSVGFTAEEIGEATREILIINIGNGAYWDAERALANVTQINFLNAEDHKINAYSTSINDITSALSAYGRVPLDKQFREVLTPLNILNKGTSHNVTVFCNSLGDTGNKDGYISTDHKGRFLNVGADGKQEFNRREIDGSHHRLDTYLVPKWGEDGLKTNRNRMLVPLMAQCALINGLNNSFANLDKTKPFTPLPEPHVLLDVPTRAAFVQALPQERGIYGSPQKLANIIGYREAVNAAFVGKERLPGTATSPTKG